VRLGEQRIGALAYAGVEDGGGVAGSGQVLPDAEDCDEGGVGDSDVGAL
jgi:hypothetical protein